MQRLRGAVHLGSDKSLLFVFIVHFVFVTVCVGEHIAIIVDPRTSVGESNGLVPFIIDYSGLRVDSLTKLGNRWSVRYFMTQE